MKVLVSDNLHKAGIEVFEKENQIDVQVKTGLPPEELKEIIGQYDAVAIRSATQISKDVIEAADKLKVIGRAGIGLDNVDIPAATKRGIVVMNTPGGNTITTAEHTIAMMLAMTRNIPRGTTTLKQRLWEKKKLQGREVYNKILGVIGYGNIGSIVANRAQGLKMRVIVYDPNVTPEHIEKDGYEKVDLEELYRRSDYITIHVPRLKSTMDMINREAFSMMKDGVMLINCSRGGIVNEDDLYEAITTGKVAGAALDVFNTEPPGQHPLLELDQIIATPHLGASTYEAQTNVAVAVAKQIIQYLKHNTILNAVNFPSVTGELLQKLSPFLYLAEKIGMFQAQITKGPIKEISIEYAGNFHDLDLTPVTMAAVKGLLMPLVKHDVNYVNAKSLAQERGIKVTETRSKDTENFVNLITIKAFSEDDSNSISGTLFGKDDSRIVRINNFRLEGVPEGYLSLIHNIDKPGSIGSIGSTLGKYNINISRMVVGREDDGHRNLIFMQTDVPVPQEVIEEIVNLPLVASMSTFTL